MTKGILFVGGPLDGRRVELKPDVETYTVPCDGSDRWRLIRQRMSRGQDQWEVQYAMLGVPGGGDGARFMAPVALDQGEGLALLVQGYQGEAQRQARDEDRLARDTLRDPLRVGPSIIDMMREEVRRREREAVTPSVPDQCPHRINDRIRRWQDR